MNFPNEAFDCPWSSPKTIIVGFFIVFCLLNIKSLPFFWHHSKPFASTISASHPLRVFSSLVTPTRCSILEIDYALHKSNSTYFTDLDISRVHLLLFLFKSGVANLQRSQIGNGVRVMPVLGGVSATFRRAIKPWEKYEVVSRVLCWDDKWIYVGSWFVVPGSLTRGENSCSSNREVKSEEPTNKNVYASAMTKYVIKAGKITVSPQTLMVASGLVPADNDDDDETARDVKEMIEAERLRILPYGRAMGELDGVLGEVDGVGGHKQILEFFRDLV